MIINLKMPEKLREITVKIVKTYIVGKDVFCDVRLFGNSERNVFRMKISKTMWRSMYKGLVDRFELGGDAGEEIDENLECITGKIMTIYARPDINRAYATKDGGVDSPKIFDVDFREDLEEAERIGGDVYNNAVNKEVLKNRRALECHNANMAQTYDEEIKRLEREIKKEKRKEIAKQDEQKSLYWG